MEGESSGLHYPIQKCVTEKKTVLGEGRGTNTENTKRSLPLIRPSEPGTFGKEVRASRSEK